MDNINNRKDEGSTFFGTPLESMYRTTKKTIQEYIWSMEKYSRYKTLQSQTSIGTILDDRSSLIDLYDSCVQQDAHLAALLETVISQIVGERYMLAKQNEGGKYIKDVEESKKIQGSQFNNLIKAIVESRWYGYSLIEMLPEIDKSTGKLNHITQIERRNVLPNQRYVVKRQGQWIPGWDLDSELYRRNYILVNSGDLGLFCCTTPSILAKKFTLSNYVNFSHTYGQPIIHAKSESESSNDRAKLAKNIANAAQNKIIVTGLNDAIDVKTFAMSNSEHIYTSLMDFVNKEVSNLIVGSETMSGETQSYVGSTSAHQDIFRERIEMYREYIEEVMNEQVLPRLVEIGYIKPGNEFKYANRVEMANKDKINLYSFLTDKYEIAPSEIEKEFGIVVGRQFNAIDILAEANAQDPNQEIQPEQPDPEQGKKGTLPKKKKSKQYNDGVHHGKTPMTDDEYYQRYGHNRGTGRHGKPGNGTETKTREDVSNFLDGEDW